MFAGKELLETLSQNFSLAIERNSVRCWFNNLGLYTFVKMTLFFTLRHYTFCDLTILTKLRLQLCVLIPTDIHTQTRKPGVGVRTFFGTSRSTKFAVTIFPFRGHVRQS